MLLFSCSSSLLAYDFSAENGGTTIYYNKLVDDNGDAIQDDNGNSTVEVTYESTPNINNNYTFYTGSVDIPSTVTNTEDGNTYTVTAIGEMAFEYCSEVTSVTIPITVKTIGYRAFYETGITEFEITENVTEIGGYAFGNCESLASFTYNSSQTSVSIETSYANGCTALITLTIGEDVTEIPDNLSYLSHITTLYYNAPEATFADTTRKTSVFANTALETLYIGENVISLTDYLFCGCPMTTVEFEGTSISSLGTDVFHNCTNLETVTGFENLDQLTEIPSWTFGRTALTSICLPNSIQTIGDHAFYETNITEFEITENVTEIGDYAFAYCEYLTKFIYNSSQTNVTVPTSLVIGSTAIDTLVIGEDVTEIPANLSYFTHISTIEYNAQNASMYDGATKSDFQDISTLTTIIIGENVVSLPNILFKNSGWPTTLIFNAKECTIGDEDFLNCRNLTDVTIGETVEKIPEGLSQLTALETMYYNALNAAMSAGYTTSVFAGCSNFTTLTIGENVESFDKYTFKNCGALTTVIYEATNCATTCTSKNDDPPFCGCNAISSITIGDKVMIIPDYLFKGDESDFFYYLNGTIKIPASVTSIGVRSFQYCEYLTGVNIVGNPTDGTVIGEHAFQYDKNINSLSIGDGVTEIGYSAMEECDALTSVNLPSSVTFIDAYAFYDCLKIDYVNIPGNEAGTIINYDAFSLDATKSAYEDGRPYASEMTLTIGENVTGIATSAFWNNTNLKTINFNAIECKTLNGYNSLDKTENVSGAPTTDDAPVFDTCPKVTTINIGSKVTKIPDYLFSAFDDGPEDTYFPPEEGHFGGLTELTIPSNVKTIGKNAFYGCSGLKELTIEEGVDEIGEKAFYRCNKLETVYEKRSLEKLRGDENNDC
ncbi:MAG: leucine-rich repeat domain-containing protein, partial [Prevotella sp.]|nr:leucine-rich repeat domain-containing protein [Prevotella sp.]